MRITFFGNFGSTNYGNECTLLTILCQLRERYPDGEFCCVCPNPAGVTATYGIEAVPIGLGRQLWRLEVLRRYRRALTLLKGTDMFVIPGTGLLTDAYGLPDWGLYSLFKWSLLAKICRCRILLVSVGAGPIYTTAGRLLAKSALSLATYRSYRDEASKTSLQDIGLGVADDHVYPDLVFGLPHSLVPPAANSDDRAGGQRVIGLGLMVYAGAYSVRNPRQEIYATYLATLTTFVERLLAGGYDIRLLAGDDDDAVVIQEFTSLLRERLGHYDERRIVYQPIHSVSDLLSELAATDIVVATRFHNVLLALVLNKPVIAITFHHKSSSLMGAMGLSAYCHDINHMDPDQLITQFQKLESERVEVRRTISQRLNAFRASLDEQFGLLFNHR